MEENNKSLISANNSLAKIEKQIAIGEKILEKANQSFILLISKDFFFQTLTIDKYKKLNTDLRFVKRNINVFIKNIISIELVTRKSRILFFTKHGKYFSISVDKILKTKDLKNLMNVETQDEIIEVISIDDINDLKSKKLFFVTQNGFVKRTKIKLFIDEILTSKPAIKLNEYDFLVNVKIVNINSQIIIGSNFGKLFCIKAFKIRSFPKDSYGDIGVKLLEQNNTVIGVVIIENFEKDYNMLFVSEKDYVRKKIISSYPYALNNSVEESETSIYVTNKGGFVSFINIFQDETTFLITTNKNIIFKLKENNLTYCNIISYEGSRITPLYNDEHIQTIVKLPNLNKIE